MTHGHIGCQWAWGSTLIFHAWVALGENQVFYARFGIAFGFLQAPMAF